jgi:hypothetical protein
MHRPLRDAFPARRNLFVVQPKFEETICSFSHEREKSSQGRPLVVLLVVLVIPGLGVSCLVGYRGCWLGGRDSLVVAGAAVVDELVLLIVVGVAPGWWC